MKKLLALTGIVAILGISAVVGSNHISDEAVREATPGVLTIKLVDF
ncbi:hypothetical protein [Terribacillus saccharophilus]